MEYDSHIEYLHSSAHPWNALGMRRKSSVIEKLRQLSTTPLLLAHKLLQHLHQFVTTPPSTISHWKSSRVSTNI